jgi:transcriptional regulator with XRE-family HTH domain
MPMRRLFVAPAETGRRVRSLRLAKGWTQHRLARAAAVSPRTVTKVENGEIGTVAVLGAIASALGASADDLLARRPADKVQ